MRDWDAFRVILAVAREGSLVGAGKVLGINHATVGRHPLASMHMTGVQGFGFAEHG